MSEKQVFSTSSTNQKTFSGRYCIVLKSFTASTLNLLKCKDDFVGQMKQKPLSSSGASVWENQKLVRVDFSFGELSLNPPECG